MISENKIVKAAQESRADAGLSCGTTHGLAYESGFEAGAHWVREHEVGPLENKILAIEHEAGHKIFALREALEWIALPSAREDAAQLRCDKAREALKASEVK